MPGRQYSTDEFVSDNWPSAKIVTVIGRARPDGQVSIAAELPGWLALQSPDARVDLLRTAAQALTELCDSLEQGETEVR